MRGQAIGRCVGALYLALSLGGMTLNGLACAAAPEGASAKNLGVPAPASAATADHGIHTFQLPSGQTLYVKESRDLPVVTIDTWVKTGSVNETDATNGVSHFLEHLIFKGADAMSAADINQRIEAYGGRFNAATSDDFTHYYISAPSRFLEPLLAIHAAMLQRASIPPQELDRERKVVQEEINMDDDKPQRRLMMTLSRLMFAGHGYAYDTLGTREGIGSVPRARILNYYHYWYRPQHMNTVIVGDVSPQRAAALVQKYFPANGFKGASVSAAPATVASDPNAYSAPPVGKPAGPQDIQTRVLADPNISQAYATLAFLGPDVENRQASCALDVAMMALASGRSSRLYKELKERQNLVNSIEGGNWTMRYAGLLYVAAETAPEKLAQSQAEIVRMVQELRANGITNEELEKAKIQTLKDFAFLNESTDGVANTIGYNVTIGSLSDYTDYVQRIQAVTREEAQAALAQYLDFNRAVWVAAIPKDAASLGAPPAEEARMKALLANAALAISQPASKSAAASASASTATGAMSILREKLPNGLTLILKNKPDADTVAVKVMMRGGRAAERIPGVAQLTAQLLQKGTSARQAEALNRELESRGMSLSASAAEDYLDVTGTAVAGDLGELLLILQDVLTHPAFRADDFAKERDALAQSLKASRDEPASLALENLGQSLYPRHPYGNLGRRVETRLNEIQPEDIRRFYEALAQPDNLVVTVVGRADPDAIRAWLLAAFGAKSSAAATPLPLAPPVETLSANKTIQDAKPRQSAAWIAQGWLAPAISSPDYAPVKALNALLGMGMSSRLFHELREKQGLAYVVSSYYPSLRDQSRLALYIGADPKNRARALAGFQREVQRLQSAPPDARELQQAKDKLMGAFLLDHESNARQAYYLGLFELLGVGYQFDQRYGQLIQRVTPADIQRVARSLFSKPMVLSIVEPAAGPAPAAPKND
ncbi:MAG: insulinase family protein [Vampirovibrionales bacterium]|nr:insulinase family protein [Vampirovibrionales bacterium]